MAPTPRTRATQARVAIDPDLRASIVHLPASLCATLLARDVVPQTLLVELGTDTQTYYCGWTGLSASASVLSDPNAGERLVVSPALASLFTPALNDHTNVSLRLFRSPPVPVAQEVHVTPLSPDDWEILSVHAEEVENNMLAQVRAAKQGQVLAVAVGRSAATVVKFLVDRTVPPTRPLDDDEAAEDGASIAVRLSTDTEVIIAPRERTQPTTEPAKTLDTTAPSSASQGPLTAHLAQTALQDVLWRVLPTSFTIPHEEEHVWSIVVPAAMAPPSVDRPAYELVALAFKHGKLCATRVACPTMAQAEGHESAPATGTATFVPGAPPDLSETDDGASYCAWPSRHIWMGAALREKLGVQDGDVVALSPPPPGAVREASDVDETGVRLQAHAPQIRAGLDKVLDPCWQAVHHVHHVRQLSLAEQGRMDVGADARLATIQRPFAGTSALLLTGPTGAGKTSLAQAVGWKAASDPSTLYRTMLINCATYMEERLPLVRARFKEWLDDAAWHAPTLLILDNLDMLIPAEGENVDAWRSTHLARALVQRIEETVRDYDVFVMATAQAPTNVHAHIQNARIWTDSVHIKPPGKDERSAILQQLVSEVAHKAQQARPELDYVALVNHTDGYHVADLQTLTDRAVHEATIRCLLQVQPVSLSMADFERAREGYTPLSLRDVKLEASTTHWADIGGLHETRQTLRETLEWPTKYAAIFAKCPLRLRSGLLLYGYPGCGKTLLASAVAKECGLNFISVKGPEILNKYIGASEKSVRDLFERAQAAKPCVLFFDEFDSIAPKRGHDSTGVTDRVVNQMLTQMDGAEGLDGVYVLAATSRPDLIDAALLRPGRLDKSLLCDMPSQADRLDILKAIARKVHVASDVDLAHWAQRTDGYSGADLQALVYNAHLEAINERIRDEEQPHAITRPDDTPNVSYVALAPTNEAQAPTTQSHAQKAALADRLQRMLRPASHATAPQVVDQATNDVTTEAMLVRTRHLHTSFQSTRPSVPQDEIARLRRIYREFAGDRDGHFPDGTPQSGVGARTSLM